MKNTNKGFTLIELLAVIVILAIIALIATPMILEVIEKARVGAAESSSLGYVDTIEKQIVINMTNGTEQLEDGVYDAPMTGISLKGQAPESGWFKVEKGQVTDYSFIIDGYVVTKGATTKKGDTTADKPAGGSVAKVCTLKSGDSLAIRSEYDCTVASGETKTFYVLEVTEDNVSLIMNQNIDNTKVAWSQDGSNHKDESEDKQAVDAKTKLTATTSHWTNVDKVSLPTYDQIHNVNNSEDLSSSTWLYDNLDGTNNEVSGIYGYWTSTPNSGFSRDAWGVNGSGYLGSNSVGIDHGFGVRPVITVSKSKI